MNIFEIEPTGNTTIVPLPSAEELKALYEIPKRLDKIESSIKLILESLSSDPKVWSIWKYYFANRFKEEISKYEGKR